MMVSTGPCRLCSCCGHPSPQQALQQGCSRLQQCGWWGSLVWAADPWWSSDVENKFPRACSCGQQLRPNSLDQKALKVPSGASTKSDCSTNACKCLYSAKSKPFSFTTTVLNSAAGLFQCNCHVLGAWCSVSPPPSEQAELTMRFSKHFLYLAHFLQEVAENVFPEMK